MVQERYSSENNEGSQKKSRMSGEASLADQSNPGHIQNSATLNALSAPYTPRRQRHITISTSPVCLGLYGQASQIQLLNPRIRSELNMLYRKS